jgi:multiple sugar transport system ATP-binding protein
MTITAGNERQERNKTMPDIHLNRVSKTYAGGIRGVVDLTLTIASGECLAIVGPSGCGKTTLLRLIAGLEEPTAGEVRVGGRIVTQLRPQHRDVAMAFQTPALYPQLRVRENLGFALRMQKALPTEIDRRVNEVAGSLGLADLLQRWPHELSGGQRQRVALGRALVRRPGMLLLDEPLSHLDVPLRAGVRTAILGLRKQYGITTLWVTHDPAEAAAAGERIAEMDAGRLIRTTTACMKG